MDSNKIDLMNSRFSWLKPTYLTFTLVLVIWICVATIKIVPVRVNQYNDGIEVIPPHLQDVYLPGFNLFYYSYFDVINHGFYWDYSFEADSINATVTYRADPLVCGIITTFWIPLYVALSWLNDKRIKSMNQEK